MFGSGDVVLGLVAALIVGLSKTALPGGALVAIPLFAHIAGGRAAAGVTLPILLAADLVAVSSYRTKVRWDVLRRLGPWIATGFALGSAFFVVVGGAGRTLEVVIAMSTLVMVVIQAYRLVRQSAPVSATPLAAALYGTSGGFTTFVSNSAGPVMNTYLLRLGLPKDQMIPTQAWFFFLVNLGKIPIYLAVGAFSDGGHFFTADSLAFDAKLLPAIALGTFAGRRLMPHIRQGLFAVVVLLLGAAGGLNLLIG